MDFLETLFGIAPDGGDGSFELLLFVVPIAGVLLLRRRPILRWLRRLRGSDRP
jgi:hypothetical protein